MYPMGKEVGSKVMQVDRGGHNGKLELYSNCSDTSSGMLGIGSWEECDTI